ncbi:MAG TPA: PspC domain-containing protein [Mycobacteriales bacterium]
MTEEPPSPHPEPDRPTPATGGATAATGATAADGATAAGHPAAGGATVVGGATAAGHRAAQPADGSTDIPADTPTGVPDDPTQVLADRANTPTDLPDTPTGAADAPAGVVDGPAGADDGPAGVVDGPARADDGPAGVVDGPAGAADAPPEVVDGPTEVADAPTEVADAPTDVRGDAVDGSTGFPPAPGSGDSGPGAGLASGSGEFPPPPEDVGTGPSTAFPPAGAEFPSAGIGASPGGTGFPSSGGFPPPSGGPGVPPSDGPGVPPPSGGPGIPPGGTGVPPSGGAGIPSGGTGVPPSGGAGFPPVGNVPPGGGGVPPGGGGVPPGGGNVPPGGGSVPPGGGGFGPGPAGGTYGPPRRLARSTQRKVVGGVAGGLAEYTGVDPVLFRVLFGVLTLFGGSGILLYAAAWLFLPADDQPVSPVESLIGRGTGGSGRTRDTAAAAAMVAAGLVLAGVVAVGDARDLALCLLVVGGAYFLLRNLRERRGGDPPQPIAPEPPPVPYQAFDVPPPAYGATATITAPAPARPDRPPKPRREHSILGVLTLCLLLVTIGILAAIDDGGAGGPDAKTYLAIATGIIGLGLLVGTFVGRARWLAWLGLPTLALLVVVSTSGVDLDGGAGDRAYSPREASDVEQTYRLGVGSLRLDLTDVDLSEQLVRTSMSLGVGNIEVVVPRTADVSIEGRSGIGEVLLFGESENGTSVSRDLVDYGPGGDGRIDLVLDLDVNIGQVRVDRAEA